MGELEGVSWRWRVCGKTACEETGWSSFWLKKIQMILMKSETDKKEVAGQIYPAREVVTQAYMDESATVSKAC